MHTVGEIFSLFSNKLSEIYEPHEAEYVTVMIFEDILNFGRMKIIIEEKQIITATQRNLFDKYLFDLMNGKPVQYVLGYCWFAGMKLIVNENVLIPRKETEELVQEILNDIHATGTEPSLIIDICTGSGCLALALKKQLKNTRVVAIDVSKDALNVARKNADKEKLEIDFICMDALNLDLNLHPDIVVSNPPYVLDNERHLMHRRVLDFEPGIALFVPDNDALLFYRHIATWAKGNLIKTGKIYFEINEQMGKRITDLHLQLGFSKPIVKKDLQDKDRMFQAVKA